MFLTVLTTKQFELLGEMQDQINNSDIVYKIPVFESTFVNNCFISDFLWAGPCALKEDISCSVLCVHFKLWNEIEIHLFLFLSHSLKIVPFVKKIHYAQFVMRIGSNNENLLDARFVWAITDCSFKTY